MRVLDLFSGIGGFSLGLERAGMRTVAFCEIDPYCRAVLRKHWPEVPCYEDVRDLTGERLRADGISVDAICGGFPCQDISFAGRGAGLAGERSGLWVEYARLIRELRPSYVIVENVSALLGRGLGRVLGDLAEIRYDAEWHCIPASAVGAPHIRDRIWIIAHPQHSDADIERSHRATVNILRSLELRNQQIGELRPLCATVADAEEQPKRKSSDQAHSVADSGKARHELGYRSQAVPHALGIGQSRSGQRLNASNQEAYRSGQASDVVNGGIGSIWATEPDVGRVAHGIPNRVERLRALGNAVVPQIPEILGRAIMNFEASK